MAFFPKILRDFQWFSEFFSGVLMSPGIFEGFSFGVGDLEAWIFCFGGILVGFFRVFTVLVFVWCFFPRDFVWCFSPSDFPGFRKLKKRFQFLQKRSFIRHRSYDEMTKEKEPDRLH